VTLGLLSPERAVSFFKRVLSTPEYRKHPARAISADKIRRFGICPLWGGGDGAK
jgi:hypothetical protein